MPTCKTQVPTSVIKEYLHIEMNKTICDNPVCKANNECKRDIRKRFSSCGHKLCVICVSEQQHSYEDEVVCMAPACNPRQTEAMDITGIPNVGLTCYASCVLQVLGQTPKFTSMLREFANGTSKHGVAAHLDELLTHVNKAGNSQNLSVNWDSMNKLMHAIFTLDQSFQRYQENDCHSFIMSLFNALAKTDEDRKEKKPKPIENSFLDGTGMDETSNSRAEDSSEGRRSTSHEDGSTARRDDTCPTKLFESRIASKFKYSTCNHTENVADQLFYSLLLSATKDVTSIHCGLDLYFKSEDFTHNQVPCRECTKQDEHTTTSRTPLLSSAPQYLMIQLARFGEVCLNQTFNRILWITF
ncbi:ubiquitin carboxyl-terminal hydrolase 30-like [Argopecten irradians]|uniref:ubiquitin carboxyl-terminal hydrolase 30-like n=1 Tax=Argopecten irradians TaxID=31199 RepID=UPI00371D6E02